MIYFTNEEAKIIEVDFPFIKFSSGRDGDIKRGFSMQTKRVHASSGLMAMKKYLVFMCQRKGQKPREIMMIGWDQINYSTGDLYEIKIAAKK